MCYSTVVGWWGLSCCGYWITTDCLLTYLHPHLVLTALRYIVCRRSRQRCHWRCIIYAQWHWCGSDFMPNRWCLLLARYRNRHRHGQATWGAYTYTCMRICHRILLFTNFFLWYLRGFCLRETSVVVVGEKVSFHSVVTLLLLYWLQLCEFLWCVFVALRLQNSSAISLIESHNPMLRVHCCRSKSSVHRGSEAGRSFSSILLSKNCSFVTTSCLQYNLFTLVRQSVQRFAWWKKEKYGHYDNSILLICW